MSDEVLDPQNPPVQALVILPFKTAEQAEQFVVLVTHNFGEFATPFVTHGTAYEYVDKDTGEIGQIFELYPESRWEAFIKDGDEAHHVLQRITQEGVPDASIDRSSDHDVGERGPGEDGGVPQVSS